MTPTSEQNSILDMATGSSANLMIQALAGTGKTSTLEMIDAAIKVQPHLYLVFAKANAVEATKRMRDTTTVRTFNSLGHRIWAQSCARNLKLNARKVSDIFQAIVDESPKSSRSTIWDCWDQVKFGVDLARAVGYIPNGHAKAGNALISQTKFHFLLDESPDDLTSDLIDAVLIRSIKLAYDAEIDFNDQVYMPALFGGTYPRFPLVLIDEYQDLSPVNHAMIAKLCKESRQIGVGDDAQAIYAFRGADTGSMAHAINRYAMAELSLSVSFRCPSEIVKNVHWRVPEFKASRQGGEVVHATERLPWNLRADAVVISRNNAPLIRACFSLLGRGMSVSVAGTDIGPKLIKTLRSLGSESLTQAQTLSAIDDWLSRKLERESKSAPDIAECMRVFASHGSSLGSAISYAEHLFKQEGTIRLLTGHKAKGLEFDHVYHLDSWLLKNQGQDRNVHYVIDTRPRESLTYIDTDNLQ